MKKPCPRPGLPSRAYTRPHDAAAITLWLDSNEGPKANARRLAMTAVDLQTLRCYPDDRALRERLAARFDVAADQVAIGTGADELLDRICRAYLAPGRRLVAPAPCFPMLPRYGQLAGGELTFVPWHQGALPTAALLARVHAHDGEAVLFLTTPNNPTGLPIATAELLTIARALPTTLIVADLAYVEFQDEDPSAALLALDNVLVVRTFSKGFGLAGLRVGYALGPAALIAPLLACGSPFPVAGPSLAMAQRALDAGPDRTAIEAVRRERSTLRDALLGRGLTVLPSDANFVFARAATAAAAHAFAETLRQRGIQIRTFSADDPFLASALRITCPGDDADFHRLLTALPQTIA